MGTLSPMPAIFRPLVCSQLCLGYANTLNIFDQGSSAPQRPLVSLMFIVGTSENGAFSTSGAKQGSRSSRAAGADAAHRLGAASPGCEGACWPISPLCMCAASSILTTWAKMLSTSAQFDFEHGCSLWRARVPSAGNPADVPSRLDVSALAKYGNVPRRNETHVSQCWASIPRQSSTWRRVASHWTRLRFPPLAISGSVASMPPFG